MSSDQITVRVDAIEQVAPMIREFTLKPVDGTLSTFSPGSHIIVEMTGGSKTYRNAYSLLSDPTDSSKYQIAVRLQESSRGGSEFMHQQVDVGSELIISPPANLFCPNWRAKKHVLIAGGIGITPFMSFLPAFKRRGEHFELHYLFRSKQSGAYHAALSESLGSQYSSYDADIDQRCKIEEVLTGQSIGTHFYVCGPEKLINAVLSIAANLGFPNSIIHVEEFAAPKPGIPFTAEIKSTGQAITVGENESLLEALEAAAVDIPHLCRGGVCGRCFTPVADGEIEHRDGFLSDEEKSRKDCMMPCVSRSQSKRLVLDI